MEDRLYLAPLKGYTDHVYRTVYATHFHGIDVAVAPFVSTSGGAPGPSRIRGLMPENNAAMPVIPQILGSVAEDFGELASRISDLGYEEINWNLGCPFPQVAKKAKGAGLLPHPDRIDAFLNRVMARIPGRLSVKIRLGRYRAEEVFPVIRVLNRFPLSEVIVHPRTGVQMYGGTPDLDTFETLLGMTDHRVVYNGDIRSVADWGLLKARFPAVRGWMTGRAVLANPFLPGLLKAPDAALPTNPERAVQAFHDDLCRAYAESLSGPGHLLDRMKGFWKYLHIPFENGESIRKDVHKASGWDDYRRQVEAFFDTRARWSGRVSSEPMQRAAGQAAAGAGGCRRIANRPLSLRRTVRLHPEECGDPPVRRKDEG